jgi:hypothetical protein
MTMCGPLSVRSAGVGVGVGEGVGVGVGVFVGVGHGVAVAVAVGGNTGHGVAVGSAGAGAASPESSIVPTTSVHAEPLRATPATTMREARITPRCPGEFIHIENTSCGSPLPAAMFSPTDPA